MTHPLSSVEADFGSIKPPYRKANQTLIESLKEAPEKTILVYYGDGEIEDEYYHLIGFESPYSNGVIPLPVLAEIFGWPLEDYAKTIEELLGDWFEIKWRSRRQWEELPLAPTKDEVLASENRSSVLRIRPLRLWQLWHVGIWVCDPWERTQANHGVTVYLTPEEAKQLASAITNGRELTWKCQESAGRIELRLQIEEGMALSTLPERGSPNRWCVIDVIGEEAANKVVTALLAIAKEVEVKA